MRPDWNRQTEQAFSNRDAYLSGIGVIMARGYASLLTDELPDDCQRLIDLLAERLDPPTPLESSLTRLAAGPGRSGGR